MLKFLLDAISNALAFSKTEAKGTLILILLMTISITASRHFIDQIKTKEIVTSDKVALASWVAEVEESFSKKNKVKKGPTYKFDRESISKPKFVIESKSNEKLVDEEKEPIRLLDLNSASAEDLQQIKGIGKAYSARILKYRALLGGFHSINQVSEVYGLDSTLVGKIKSRFLIKSKVRPIEFNVDSAKNLARHPYISYDLAWIIINYQKQNGELKGLEDLSKIKAIDDSLILKLRPYLK